MSSESPVVVIDSLPSRVSLREIWESREVLYMFALRDIKIRYQQTAVGMSWAILQPLLIMLVLSAFATLLRAHTGTVPYPLFLISGLIPWTYFTHGFTQTTHSLVSNGAIIGKIYFPRVIIPIAAVVGGAVDFFVASLLLPAFMVYYGVRPTLAVLSLPLFVLMALLSALALGLWLAVLNVRYRDVANALPFVTQLLFFTTPIAYSPTLLPEPWRTVSGLNPMVGVVTGFRWAILGEATGGLQWSIAVSAATIVVLLVGGLWYFQRNEPTLADEL
jgi:lipopolysaccharide transport system permease protein